jgi:hypothetical protein
MIGGGNMRHFDISWSNIANSDGVLHFDGHLKKSVFLMYSNIATSACALHLNISNTFTSERALYFDVLKYGHLRARFILRYCKKVTITIQ